MQGFLDFDQVVLNQVMAARVAEATLKDLEAEAETKLVDTHSVLDDINRLTEEMARLREDRDALKAAATQTQTENDQIKTKFAKLLDQFQEYVNENEFKNQEEDLRMKQS